MTTQPKHLTTPEDYQSLIDSCDTFLFDCDGVLWHGDHLVPGITDVLAHLRKLSKPYLPPFCMKSLTSELIDKRIIFVTNNATKSRKNYKKKFDKLGVQAEMASCSAAPLD